MLASVKCINFINYSRAYSCKFATCMFLEDDKNEVLNVKICKSFVIFTSDSEMIIERLTYRMLSQR